MLRKIITYTDYNGTERTEPFYFNLTKAELAEMDLTTEGGMQERIQRIVDAKDGRAIMHEFKSILMKAYGKKSDDGKRFIKSEEISREFLESPAYDQIFMELITDADAAADFVKAILPVQTQKEQ